MKKILFLGLLLCIVVESFGQRINVYKGDDNTNYLAVFAYGLPRAAVKNNDRMKRSKLPVLESVTSSQGMTRRHHITGSVDVAISTEGYRVNADVAFAFLIAKELINIKGEHQGNNLNNGASMSWSEASGWNKALDTEMTGSAGSETTLADGMYNPASIPTGCAAYRGNAGTDVQGSWRLPTQREILIMVLVMEDAMRLNQVHGLGYIIPNAKHWTSTELHAPGSAWKAWVLDSKSGSLSHEVKTSAGIITRCVKDIILDENN